MMTGYSIPKDALENPFARALIKNGNVYILTDDKTYTITGQIVESRK